MFKISIIIPTYNRPEELKNCIYSLLMQTVKPDELIIVDDGNLPELPIGKECKESGIEYIYYKKDTPGLTESRNIGIKLASGDIIFFFDDDTVMSPDYLEKILQVYTNDQKKLTGGVAGIITNTKPLTFKQRFKRTFQILFLLSGFDEGKVLPSGFTTNFDSRGTLLKKRKEVDFLPGCAMSFRKEIFKEFFFDSERYLNYGLGEDKDFTYQVSKKYKLVINPEAKLMHLESPKMRMDEFKESKMFLMDRYLFFQRHVKKGWWSWLFFYYAVFGHIVISTMSFMISPRKNEKAKLLGILNALQNIVQGNIRVV
jgi:GT2 family glycosyltransferase